MSSVALRLPALLQNDDPSTRLSSQSTHLTASKVGTRLSRAQSSGDGSAIGYLFLSQCDVFKSSDIVYIDTFSCFLTLFSII